MNAWPATPRSPVHNPGGFTLVEMMVALALSIFVMSLFTVLFVQATGAMSKMRGITEIDQNVRTAASVLKRDLNDVTIVTDQGAVKPNRVFVGSVPETRPRGGYFLIEENSTPIRQGIDQWGLPVEVDIDDVLAFTVGRRGDGPDEMYFGRVPRNSFWDTYGNSAARFDDDPDPANDVGNGITSSKKAEVVYFLRPDIQYIDEEIRGHDRDRSSGSGSTFTETAFSPATFTLYRRQLLIMPQDIIDWIAENDPDDPAPPAGTAGSYVPGDLMTDEVTNYYSRFEVAAKPKVDATLPGEMQFVSLADIDERRFRYGINNVGGTEFPFSWATDATGCNASATVFNLRNGNDAQWLGRPISLESNLEAVDLFTLFRTEFSNSDADGNLNGLLDDLDGQLNSSSTTDNLDDKYTDGATIEYPYGSDVLLRNVLSFDVKVFDDDPRDETAAQTASGASSSVASDPTAAINPDRTANADERLPEFVDLGYHANGADGVGDADYDDPAVATEYSFAWADANGWQHGFPCRWRHGGRNGTMAVGSAVGYRMINTYDTWSDAYEPDPAKADPIVAGAPVLRPIPYAKPLAGIQIKIRVLEPGTGIVREVTIIHYFQD